MPPNTALQLTPRSVDRRSLRRAGCGAAERNVR
jgi:hypothetical protein